MGSSEGGDTFGCGNGTWGNGNRDDGCFRDGCECRLTWGDGCLPSRIIHMIRYIWSDGIDLAGGGKLAINKMMETKHDWDCLLVKAMGMALVTVALTWLPSVFGGVAQLVAAASSYGFDQDEMLRKFTAQMISMSVGKLASFVVLLLLLARWVFGYPVILQKMLKRVDEA